MYSTGSGSSLLLTYQMAPTFPHCGKGSSLTRPLQTCYIALRVSRFTARVQEAGKLFQALG